MWKFYVLKDLNLELKVLLIFINCIVEWVCVDVSENEGGLRTSYSYRIRWLNNSICVLSS